MTTRGGRAGWAVALMVLSAVPASMASPPATAGAQECAMTPAPSSAELTVVRGDRLIELAGGSERCLHVITEEEVGRPVWAPDGTRVLLNPSRLLDAAGAVSDTGFFPENARARWSMPTGKSIVAPAVKDGSLLKRLAGNAGSRLDITFALPTEAVAYHPAGMHVFAAGNGPQGPGLYVASNLGKSPTLIAQLLEPDSHITEIVAPAVGDHVLFIHDHGHLAHVHRLSLPDLGLVDLLTVETEVSGRVSGLVALADGTVAVRSGDCTGPGGVLLARPDGTTVDLAQAMPGASTLPVGEFGGKLVVESRPQGCSGPATVVAVDPANPADQMVLATDVSFAAMRTPTPEVGQMPGDIVSQAPG